MTLYFDSKVQFLDSDAVSTVGRWHPNDAVFAVCSFCQDRGGSVTIFDDAGEPLRDVTYPVHSISQATALGWHPEKKLLVTGWENGEIYAWIEGNREFTSVQGPHRVPIVLLEFSEKGGRMVTADSMGLLTGWRCEGQFQFLTMFSHDLKDTLLHITFRCTIENPMKTELSNLARAAVEGDESALDTLTAWRPRTAARNLTHSGVQDNHCFYVGTQSGIVYYLNQGGTCIEVLKDTSSPINQILWHPSRDAIVTLMEDMTVGHYLVESTGILTELDRVKLSGKIPGNNGAISWAASSLAIITGDYSVRIWDIDTSENYLLATALPSDASTDKYNPENTSPFISKSLMASKSSTNQKTLGAQANEVFTCLAYCRENQTLCAGTNLGNLYTWKKVSTNFAHTSLENSWQLSNISTVRGAIKQCYWGTNELAKPCVMINCISNVYILKEQPLLCFHQRNIWALQRSANQIFVENSRGSSHLINADISVTNISLTENNIVLSNERTIVTYRISKEDQLSEDQKSISIKQMHSFSCECIGLFIYDQSIFCLTVMDVKIYSLGGVVLKEIKSNENEGKPIGIDLTGHYLTIFTMNGYIRVYDVSRHEPKPLTQSKCGFDLFDKFGEVIMAKSNCNGTHLAFIIANESLVPDGKIYVWNIEKDKVEYYDFLRKGEASVSEDDFVPRLPIALWWDADDSRILIVEARSRQQQRTKVFSKSQINYLMDSKSVNINRPGNSGSHVMPSESQAFVMFTTDKCLINKLQVLNLASGEQVVNMCTPNVITLKVNVIHQTLLQDFKGMENCDIITRNMVLDFSLNVAQGNMDMAFRCIRTIQSEGVWTNLAKMCVETGRLDVARVCLGHLKKARSVRALRTAMADDNLEKEAKVAVLAIELGMYTEAEALYKKCGRLDLLNKLLQASGKIDQALQVAEQGDRVHLKNAYYQKAEQLRESGNFKEAIEFYEKTQDPVQSVTQVLLTDADMLKSYMQNTTNLKMLKWWGQYIESTRIDMESAFKIYQKAEDWFSQVKILCFLGQLSKADSIARQCGDKAACYHLARHYEIIGKYQEAIQFYTRAQTYGNAVRICKENDYQDELWNVASSGRARDKAIAAAYFEDCGSYKRAVELYHRAGMLHKAVELAFTSQQPETLQVIASELNAESDPDLVNRCAEFFTSIEQHQRAVQLLAKSKQYEHAIQICIEKRVPITESLAELLTPPKDEVAEELRIQVVRQLGEILQEQGDYHMATKKFTQAGDKIRAMKSLLKSGDTEKIIFFANMSRQREVYIMAANYLQALNWSNDSKIMKHIVTFYSKGQAYDSLANFYANCAQVEIDDFRDYEKALNSMHEASKCLTKVPNSHRAADNLQKTITEVKTVLNIIENLEGGNNQAVIAECRNVLVKPEKPPIRQADVLGFLVQALVASKLYVEALGVLKELASKDPSWCSRGLLDKHLVQKVSKECNVDFESIWNSGKRGITNAENDLNLNDDEIQEEFE